MLFNYFMIGLIGSPFIAGAIWVWIREERAPWPDETHVAAFRDSHIGKVRLDC